MVVKNLSLLTEFRKLNVILENGQLNRKYKILLKNHFPNLFNYELEGVILRETIFLELYDYYKSKCSVCKQNFTKFICTNYLNPNPEKIFSTVCSKGCQYKLVSKLQLILANDPVFQQKRILKFSNTMAIIDENGNTKARNLSLKSANTKENTIQENGQSVAQNQIIKTLETKYRNNTATHPSKQTAFHLYRKEVHKLSAKENISNLENSEKRGHFNTNGYHLDHIVSIFDGFNHNLPNYLIASIVNLRFIPAVQNTGKSGKSDMLISTLLLRYYEFYYLNISFVNLTQY